MFFDFSEFVSYSLRVRDPTILIVCEFILIAVVNKHLCVELIIILNLLLAICPRDINFALMHFKLHTRKKLL